MGLLRVCGGWRGRTISSCYVTQLWVVANYSRDGRGEAAKRPGKPRKYEGRGFLTLVLRFGLLLLVKIIADAPALSY
jgi:hypothetical protein